MNDMPERRDRDSDRSSRPFRSGEGRPSRDSDRRPAGAEDRGRGRGARQEGDRPVWQQLVSRPKREDAEKSPLIPEEIMPADLAMPVRLSRSFKIDRSIVAMPGVRISLSLY